MMFFKPPRINSKCAFAWNIVYFAESIELLLAFLVGFMIVLPGLATLALNTDYISPLIPLAKLLLVGIFISVGIDLWTQAFLGIVEKEAAVNNSIGAIDSALPLICGIPKEEPVHGRKAVAKGAHCLIALIFMLALAKFLIGPSFRLCTLLNGCA